VTPSPIGYTDWCDLLQRRFFTSEFAGEPVMFFVDDDCLAELAGGRSDDPAQDLAAAVRSRVARNEPRRLFIRIERTTQEWRRAGGEEAPPCLPLLALAVLTACRMRRSGRYAANNYYDRFVELLDLSPARHEVVASYAHSLPTCWRALEWWLDERHQGALGYSTIAEDPHFTNIGYADSQTLFSSSDHAKLGQFLEWIGHTPGESIDDRELLASFKLWSARRDDLSVGASLMVSSETHVEQLGRILSSAARRWSGAVQADDGRQQARLRLALESFPRLTLSLWAERPDGFPAEATFRDRAGTAIALRSSQPGWYDEVPLDLSGTLLRQGIRLISDRYALALPATELHILSKDRELGWATATSLVPSVPHWLITLDARRHELERYLDAVAQDEWERVKSEALPPGWIAIRNVVVNAQPAGEPPEWLRPLVPATRRRVALAGGLPLNRPRQIYLSGGEPDLWFPPGGAEDEELQLDGQRLAAAPGAPQIRLANRRPPVGDHRVGIGGTPPMRFTTMETLGRLESHPDSRIGHVVRKTPLGYEPLGHEAHELGVGSDPSEIRVVGAAIEGQEGDLPVRQRSALLLPMGAAEIVLLGRRPGEIEEVICPERPDWMRELGLAMPVFEHEPVFPVAWVVSRWLLAPEVRTRPNEFSLDPGSPNDAEPEAESVMRWRTLLLRAPAPPGEEAGSLWEQYRVRALGAGGGAQLPEHYPWRGTPQRFRRTDDRPLDELREQQAISARWDLLLEWASEVGEGSYVQLREAVDWVFEDVEERTFRPTPAYAARVLATLGHIEIDWHARKWTIAPGTLARLPFAGGHALITGSRTRTLAARIELLARDEEAEVYVTRYPQPNGPCAVFIACDDEHDLEALAGDLEIRYEHAAGERIAQLLPSIDSYLGAARSAPLPARFGVSKLNALALRFEAVEADNSPGLYEYEVFSGNEWRLRDADGAIYSLDRSISIYAALSRWGENVLRYMPDSLNGTLVVPRRAPLPDLHARAVALCSGLVPQRHGNTLYYLNVPRWVADSIARSLDQTLLDLP
jgi:hypothetical protein